MRIMIVDDDLVSRTKMEAILKTFGTVETVGGGGVALEAFRKAWVAWQPFDLISLDISMPDMNGAEVLKQIRAVEKEKGIDEDKRVKVMMVTGTADRDTVTTCKQHGCNDYVVKPFTKEVVTAKLRSMGFAPTDSHSS